MTEQAARGCPPCAETHEAAGEYAQKAVSPPTWLEEWWAPSAAFTKLVVTAEHHVDWIRCGGQNRPPKPICTLASSWTSTRACSMTGRAAGVVT
jgi:hypothetical protein